LVSRRLIPGRVGEPQVESTPIAHMPVSSLYFYYNSDPDWASTHAKREAASSRLREIDALLKELEWTRAEEEQPVGSRKNGTQEEIRHKYLTVTYGLVSAVRL
jgi:hypothetical protein